MCFCHQNIMFYRFGDLKLQNPENKAFAQMFQKSYAGKILECHLNLLNVVRVGGYLPDRVINLILQYLSNRLFYTSFSVFEDKFRMYRFPFYPFLINHLIHSIFLSAV